MSTDPSLSFSSDHETGNVAFACAYFLLFAVALLFNSVSAWVSLHLRSTSTFIVYLKNLAAADLLVTLCLPAMALSKLPGASVEVVSFTCRYTFVIYFSCLYITLSLMGLISLDRYFKVVRPYGRLLGQSVMFSLVSSTLVWIVIFGSTAVPTLILASQVPFNVTNVCGFVLSPDGQALRRFVILFTTLLFWLISLVIGFCYICITLKVLQSFRNSGSNNSQGSRKTKLRVFLILLEFFLCFVPFHLLRIPDTLIKLFHSDDSIAGGSTLMSDLFLWMSTANVCLDPLLYIYLCKEYRNKLVEMMEAAGICVGLCSSEKQDDSQDTSQ
ncbi:P2Y purinoceptor 12-like [Solea solea]|uniref:P2Y purinoceptor 12-like n=1 Tax=Solea solea TaxID=90069 RepID=UPI00272994B8|nr:P2Y purinoceptor 12-like [Solea solea]